MPTRSRQREVRFTVADAHLVRSVVFADGRSYAHRCSLEVFETVARAVAETPAEGDGTTLERITRAEDLPFTQVNIALEFLKERGLVEVRHRRCYPGSTEVYLDAMVEFHALKDGAVEQ